MHLVHEPAPGPVSFEQLARRGEGLARIVGARNFVGSLPLGQDMSMALPVTQLGLARNDAEQRILDEWRAAWESSGGGVQSIYARGKSRSKRSLPRTRLLITGPAATVNDASGTVYPAVGFTTEWGAPRSTGMPVEVGGKRKIAERLAASIGFVEDATGRHASGEVHYKWLPESRLSYIIGKRGLKAIAANREDIVPRGLTLLAYHTGAVALAASDPLKAAAPRLVREAMTDPEQAAQLLWQRSSRSTADQSNVVEVCFLPVDADAFGSGRKIIAVRDSDHPHKVVLCFSDDEWDALVGGAKDGEFDVT